MASQNGVHLTGFAYRATLSVTKNPDLDALDVGSVRVGTDLTVNINNEHVRLLSVHLKSGCFDEPLASTTPAACVKLKQQLPKLEEWIDAPAAANEAFVVLGDFNRRMKTGEPFYTEIDDANPPNADLTLITDGRTSACWNGEFPQFIDHIVLAKNATPWVEPNSFAQLLYDDGDSPFKAKITDHCLISIRLQPGASGTPSGGNPGPLRIKGNINSSGKRLYHRPDCPSYAQTEIAGPARPGVPC